MDSKDMSKPLDAGSFVSIMDSENIELFNRNHFSDTNTGWLWFMEQKRLQHYRARRRWTNALTVIFAVFFVFAMLFMLMAMRSPIEPINDDDDVFLEFQNPLSEPSLDHMEQCLFVSPNSRIDCNPDPPISKNVCLSRGCCWMPAESGHVLHNVSNKALPPLNVPYCFYGPDYRGYNITESHDLPENGRKVAYLKRVHPSGFKRDVDTVKIEVDELSTSVLRIKMVDSKAARYEVPIPKLNLPKTESTSSKLYRVELYKNNMSLVVFRIKTMTPLFEVNLTRLIYSDQFIQITNKLPSDFIYGIGECVPLFDFD